MFANYYSSKGHTFIDRRIYLPEEWCQDRQRREEAGVPESVVFRTKPELGLEMIRTAVREGILFQWVGGDCVYGDSPTFVQGVRELGKWYVLDVSSADSGEKGNQFSGGEVAGQLVAERVGGRVTGVVSRRGTGIPRTLQRWTAAAGSNS